MALEHARGLIEIGCNLQASTARDSPGMEAVLQLVRANLPARASVSKAYVIGLTSAAAIEKALADCPDLAKACLEEP